MADILKRHIWLVILAGFLVMSISLGTRQNFGLLLAGMTADLGIDRQTFAFAMALQNLMWGLFSPPLGALADKYGSGRMIAIGGLVYAGGLWGMGHAEGTLGLNFSGGLLLGFAQAATGFAVVLAAVAKRVRPEKRSMALGLVSAGGSFGQLYMAPVSLGLIEGVGWSMALAYIAILALMMTVLASALTGRSSDAVSETAATAPLQTLKQALHEALGDKSFLFLTAGFFVCGFQVAFVAVHLPAYLQDLGFGASLGATAIALIGFFNILGTWAAGVLGGKYPKRFLLSTLYVLRSLVITVFLMVPPSEIAVMIFASSLGLLWLGTVPLTSGLVAQIFGVRYMSTLFGIVFLSHQLGSFIGVWWGGYAFDVSGTYDPVWYASIALGLTAAILHLPIKEQPLKPVAQEA